MTKFYEKVAYRDEEEDIQSQKSVDKWIFGLLLIVIGFVPLIVMASVVEVQSPLITNVSALTGGAKGDLFTHYKALLVVVITVVAALLFMMKILFMDGKIRKTKLNYAIGAFAVAIVLSTIFSPNISIALHGQYNRSDGAISWLCYLALFFIAMNIDYPKKVLNYVLYALYPFVIINLYIITMNFYGHDLLQKPAVQKLVQSFLPAGANISEDSILVGTLNQWNYMSGMFAIMTVMFLAAAILEKHIGRAIGHLVIAIMSIVVMLMSISTSGFLTVCVMMLVVLFAAFRSEKKAQSFAMIAVFLVATAPVFHVLALKEDKVWRESFGFFTDSNPYGWKPESNTSFLSDTLLETTLAAEHFELPTLPTPAMSAGSGRIYIWEKTLYLLKERFILGYGLDTIMYNFPHYNIQARSGLQDENIIVDKPHNMYIGILYGTGLLGIVSLLFFICINLFMTLKFVMRHNNLLVWAFNIAWGAYLIQALFNDSVSGVSTTMWIIAGILSAIVLKNKEQIYERDN
ncbi:O-antigen ligase family protein [Lysinibacillus sp. NPDC098008]|uniref:O-antigen ligase family protein n=1 Tax=Lysinibacillus sp. NPDC098008 TaxID=3364146 RepID=UPI00382C53B5